MGQKEKVTRVIDGDSFETASGACQIRLADVDTPEKGQRGYAEARAALKHLVEGKEVMVETVARDTYGRCVSKVTVAGRSVNAAMKNHSK